MSKLKHIAIIMDGNGRWANKRRRPRVWGHIRGASNVTEIVERASDLNLDALTLYAFSSENWSRPDLEISTLFKLLKKFLVKERKKILKNNIHFKVIGDVSGLAADTVEYIKSLEAETKDNTGLKLRFAFGYGSRGEITRAVNRYFAMNPNTIMTEEGLAAHLDTADLSDVDLMIRTGGDQRISNFLLWQSAYAELFFTKTYWPDFTPDEFQEIIESVLERERRFGGLGAKTELGQISQQALKTKSNFVSKVGLSES